MSSILAGTEPTLLHLLRCMKIGFNGILGYGDDKAEVCRMQSDYYCLLFWTTNELRARQVSAGDRLRIGPLAMDNYQRLNWFNVFVVTK